MSMTMLMFLSVARHVCSGRVECLYNTWELTATTFQSLCRIAGLEKEPIPNSIDEANSSIVETVSFAV